MFRRNFSNVASRQEVIYNSISFLVSSKNSKDPVLQDYPSPDYERSPSLNMRDVRVSVPPGDAPGNLEGTTEL